MVPFPEVSWNRNVRSIPGHTLSAPPNSSGCDLSLVMLSFSQTPTTATWSLSYILFRFYLDIVMGNERPPWFSRLARAKAHRYNLLH